jgi:hypothetical protein
MMIIAPSTNRIEIRDEDRRVKGKIRKERSWIMIPRSVLNE